MTAILVHNGHIVAGNRCLTRARLTLEGVHIVAIDADPAGADAAADEELDLAGGWLLPGFIDTQVNGGGGVLFNDAPTVAGIAAIGAAHARFGTTAFLPTLISDTVDAIAVAIDAVEAAVAAQVPGVVGIHIEGPFINQLRKGIHSEARIRPLDGAIVELLCRPRPMKVVLTLAPELADPADIERLAAHGILLSAGHSDASYAVAMAAFARGVGAVTHLYNAMSPFGHREPGLAGAALDDASTYCGLIADGVHVSAPALRLALKAKGAERIMLATDAMSVVGTPARTFQLDGQTIVIEDGSCRDVEGRLAGSALDMASAVRNMVSLTGVDVAGASRMASGTPASFLGLGAERGVLAPGRRADFAVLDSALQPVATWIGGTKLG